MPLFRSVLAFFLLAASCAATAEVPLIEVIKGHSATLYIEEDIKTVALGDPSIAQTVIVKPNTVLINARAPGSTSLTLFGKTGKPYDYRLLVTHDLGLLRNHLKKLDSRITVETDPNGDAVVLAGIAETKEVIERAVEAAVRFFGDTSVSMTNALNARAMNDPKNIAPQASNPVRTVTPQNSGDVEKLATGATRVINLITTAESMMPASQRLEKLLQQVDKRISVELANSVIVLKGAVATPAALTRALTIADRFVSGNPEPEFKVISDQGGVLAGDSGDGKETLEANVAKFVSPGAVLGTNTRNRGNAGVAGALNQEPSPAKGNIGQNISRGDIITAAQGRVMSLIRVDDQPRIEMQMRIVAVDRGKTDKMGIDWRLDGTKVHLSSPLGDVIGLYPGADKDGKLNPFLIGKNVTSVIGLTSGTLAINAFLETVESKGAAITLSEPLISAASGETAAFLVGGNIPIPSQVLTAGTPTQNAQSAQVVNFVEYGLRLIVRPTVLENGKISVVLDQTLSAPDYGKQIQFLGTAVPGFTQKTVSTVTEADDGETWAVAGLLSEEDSRNLRAVPFISKIPILGTLFRRQDDKSSRSELMITINARRVGAGAHPTSFENRGIKPRDRSSSQE